MAGYLLVNIGQAKGQKRAVRAQKRRSDVGPIFTTQGIKAAFLTSGDHQRALENGVDPGCESFTVCQLFQRWDKASPRPLRLHASH